MDAVSKASQWCCRKGRALRLAFWFVRHPGKYINQESYFPEKRYKGKTRIYFDYLRHILRYNEIDRFYFAFGFDGKSRREMRRYLPYDRFVELRNRRNQSGPYNYICVLRDKRLFDTVARTFGMPVPPLSGEIKDGHVWVGDRDTSLRDFLRDNPEVFIKKVDGECGLGVYKVNYNPGDDNLLVNGDHEVPLDEFRSWLKGRYVVQPRIRQHPEMSRIYPHALNTLRVMTVVDPATGAPVHLGTTMRVGAGGNVVDNWALGGIIVGVGESGSLKELGYYKPGYGTVTRRHPDTSVDFAGFRVPYFKEAVDMCLDFHSRLGIHSIGWDVAITPDGPVFIEGNDNWEITLPQLCDGPLRDRFTRLCAAP